MVGWRKNRVVASLILLLVWAVLGASHVDAQREQKRAIAIESQALGKSLNELARQTGLQVVLFDEIGADVIVPSLQGWYVPTNALNILLEHTELEYEYIGEGTYIIQMKKPE